MNPHVLFNAISGLTELVREDAAAAERALVNLSELLRGLLEHGDKISAPLAQERILVEQYLAIEQVRLGQRLQVEWHWDGTLEHHPAPPLLVQPLVENAIKHGIAPQRGGGKLAIHLRGSCGFLELEVANTGVPPDENAPEGLGVRNLRERLKLLGEPSEAFRLVREGEWTRALVRLSAKVESR
jgi:sensor histidine kinase YesM